MASVFDLSKDGLRPGKVRRLRSYFASAMARQMGSPAMHWCAWPRPSELLETAALTGTWKRGRWCAYLPRATAAVTRPISKSAVETDGRRRITMREYKDQNRQERLERAAKAKQEILEKFRSRPAADDPAVLARAAERKAIADAREAREKERDERKRKEAEERAQREAVEKAEREARERREAVEKVIRDAAEAAERKAERDRRYAARKARQAARR
jgi:uncharacterized protein DUF6481